MEKLSSTKQNDEVSSGGDSVASKKTSDLVGTKPIRVKIVVENKLSSIVEKINTYGPGSRKVKKSRIIEFAIELLSESHLIQLREETLTNNDRLDVIRKGYADDHGDISMEHFLGKLFTGELNAAKLQKQYSKIQS